MTALVFNTQIMLISFCIILIQLLLIPTLGIFIFMNKKDKSRLRFLILTLSFLSFNFFGSYFPDEKLNVSMILQNCFIYGSGIFMAGYFFLFIAKEFNFNMSLLFSIKSLFIGLILSFIIGYGLVYLFTHNFKYAYYTFICSALIIALLFCAYSLKQFMMTYKTPSININKSIYYACFIGIVLMALLPVISLLNRNQAVEVLLVNTAYFF